VTYWLNCPCGETITGSDEDALVANAEAHLADRHPELVGAYDRDQVLFMAKRPTPAPRQ